jgi:hypothetical protein
MMMEFQTARDQAMADTASMEAKTRRIREERLTKEGLPFEAMLRQA